MPGHVTSVDWSGIAAHLLGGLALLLFGMSKTTEAMKLIAGEHLKDILASLSRTTLRGFITGICAAGIMQSSTVVSVMLVGFVSTNVMTFKQSVPVLLGIQIGCTIVTQIIAFASTTTALFIIATGFWIWNLSKQPRLGYYGSLLLGAGLMMYGNQLLSRSIRNLKDYEPFIEFLASISSSIVGILCGALITVMVQASSATVAIVSALAQQNLVSMQLAVAVVLGANIGTTGASLLTSIGKSRSALRVAVAYVLQKFVGVCVVLPLLGPFVHLTLTLSPNATVPRQVANSHTFFNIVVAVIFLPFTNQLADFVMRIVPENARDIEAHRDEFKHAEDGTGSGKKELDKVAC